MVTQKCKQNVITRSFARPARCTNICIAAFIIGNLILQSGYETSGLNEYKSDCHTIANLFEVALRLPAQDQHNIRIQPAIQQIQQHSATKVG